MKELSLPNYNELSRIFNQAVFQQHPAEVHGLMMGILCGHPNAADWEALVIGAGEKVTPEVYAGLRALYEVSHQQLKEFSFDFQLFLPDDDETLSMRAEALTLWCQGFLTGLQSAQIAVDPPKPSEISEAVNDLVEIAKMNHEEVVANEEDEVAYTELVEYVRMAVIFIYQTLQEKAAAPQQITTDHLH